MFQLQEGFLLLTMAMTLLVKRPLLCLVCHHNMLCPLDLSEHRTLTGKTRHVLWHNLQLPQHPHNDLHLKS